MNLLTSLRFSVATYHRYYDLITIGPYANKVAHMLNLRYSNTLLTKLLISNQHITFQAQLLNINNFNPYIKLERKHLPQDNFSVLMNTSVKSITPSKSKIELWNGDEISYKQLVFSGNVKEWKDYNYRPGMEEHIAVPHTFAYSDYKLRNVNELYARQNGQIVFVIPKGRHFGCENYFMLHLQQSLRKLYSHKKLKDHQYPFSIKIINKGSQLLSHCPHNNKIITDLLLQGGIQIVNNATIKDIDFVKHEIVLGDGKTEQYSSLFQYLPMKIPDLLASASIDPFKVNKHTLQHQEYPNISIIGNILPTNHSFYTMNYQNRVIMENLANSYLKNNKKALYQGEAIIPFWSGRNQLRYFSMNYEGETRGNNVGKNPLVGWLLAKDKQMFGAKQIEWYLNGQSYGWPYYFCSPTLQQVTEKRQIM